MSAHTVSVYLSLGSNLGDRAAYLAAGVEEVRSRIGAVAAASAVYESAPWGAAPETSGPYLNQVVAAETHLRPEDCLEEVLAAEAQHGRARTEPNAPRTLDVDLLLYGQQIVAHPHLRLPHPRLHLRRFVLAPLAEIAPDLVHPVSGRTIAELLAACGDRSPLTRFA